MGTKLGQQDAANSLSVVMASDQPASTSGLTWTVGTAVAVVANAAAVQVVPANANRKSLTIFNDGAGDGYRGYVAGVTATVNGVPLGTGKSFTWPRGDAPKGIVYFFSVPGTTIRYEEGV